MTSHFSLTRDQHNGHGLGWGAPFLSGRKKEEQWAEATLLHRLWLWWLFFFRERKIREKKEVTGVLFLLLWNMKCEMHTLLGFSEWCPLANLSAYCHRIIFSYLTLFQWKTLTKRPFFGWCTGGSDQRKCKNSQNSTKKQKKRLIKYVVKLAFKSLWCLNNLQCLEDHLLALFCKSRFLRQMKTVLFGASSIHQVTIGVTRC